MKAAAALAVLAVSVAVAARARAAGPLGRDGEPIRTSQYSVDLTQTPILAGARVTGLAGAYVAIAEGIDGNIQTPVGPAVRVPSSIDHFDYDFGLGLTLPATLTSTDFFNTGQKRTQLADANQKGFVFITPAINLQWGTFGLGATLELSNYTLGRRSDLTGAGANEELSAGFSVAHFQAAQAFAKGQLLVGLGLRLLNLNVSSGNSVFGEASLFSTTGAGGEAGVLWTPYGLPFRVGAAFRSAVSTAADPGSKVVADAAGDRVIGDPNDPATAFWLPAHVDQPWDLNVGFAYQFGPRPFNVPFIDPDKTILPAEREAQEHRTARHTETTATAARLRAAGRLDAASRDALDAESRSGDALDELRVARVTTDTLRELKFRQARLPRPYVLVSVSLVVTGALADAVGVESFLQRAVGRSGEHVVLSPRLGVETEVIPHRFKVRAGTYYEPTRFATSQGRVHGTFGFDLKLLPWNVFGLFEEDTEWRLSTALDAAARYLGWGVSIGTWH